MRIEVEYFSLDGKHRYKARVARANPNDRDSGFAIEILGDGNTMLADQVDSLAQAATVFMVRHDLMTLTYSLSTKEPHTIVREY